MMSYHSETTQHYNETMENLKVINETIVYLIKVPYLSRKLVLFCVFEMVGFST